MIRTDDSGGILEQLLQTQQAQQADLAIGLDNTYLQTALNFCLLQAHNASAPTFLEAALEPYNGPLALPFDRGTYASTTTKTRVDGTNLTVPTSLWNLTEPEWNGLQPSHRRSLPPRRAFMSATIDYFENDEDNTTDAFDWWKAMAENGAIFTTGWTEAYEIHYSGGYGEWVEEHLGDAVMTVSYCHSPGVEAFYGGNWTKSTSLTLPRSSFHQVEYAGVINGGTELEAANAAITYLLSEEVNRDMPENNLMQSVLVNATWPETDGYAYHTDLPELNAEISNERIADEMEDWLSAWKDATVILTTPVNRLRTGRAGRIPPTHWFAVFFVIALGLIPLTLALLRLWAGHRNGPVEALFTIHQQPGAMDALRFSCWKPSLQPC